MLLDLYKTTSVLLSTTLLLQLLLLCNDVTGQHRRRQRRQQTGAPGPNMCKVQFVLGTKEKFFTHCVAKHLKMICERPTFERWECCSGYARNGRDKGCTKEIPLNDIMETTRELDLAQFVAHAEEAGLDQLLSNGGPFTVFVPTDEAVRDASPKMVSMLSPDKAEIGSQSLLNYHVAPGRLNISTFRDKNQEFTTLHNGDRVRVNKYAYGVATVNCARIVRPDELATNGIVHVIDKVINPLDVQGTLADRVMSDDRFSQFQLALMVSDMVKKLKKEKQSFTLLAPTNQAFAKLPSDILDMILTDADTAEKVIKRHIVRGVYCADAIVVAVGLKTLDDARLLFRCKRDGLRINEAKVLYPDLVSSNGVLHGIDTVLLPDSVKSTPELLHDMRLDGFLELARQAGLNSTLERENITLFSPTDRAIAELSPQYLAALREQPLKMEKLLKYHMVEGRVSEDQLVGESNLQTLADLAVKIKVKVSRKGVTLDKAAVDEHPRECKNALVHKVDKVMIPPEDSLMDYLLDDPNLSKFTEMVEKSGVSETLLPDGSYTLLAPTNRALEHVDQKQLQQIIDDPNRLTKFVERHMISRMVLKCSIPELGVYTIRSLQRDETNFAYDSRQRLYVNTHARVVSDDIMTSNGVLYKIDHVLPCTCERALKSDRGHYIGSHRYKKLYR